MTAADEPTSEPEELRALARGLPPAFCEAVLTAITESSLDGILLLDRNLEAVIMNERFKEFWRIKPEHTVYGSGVERRRGMAQLAVDPEKVKLLHRLMTDHQGQEYSGEITLTTGTVLTGLSRPIYDGAGEVLGQLILYRDGTDLHEAEAERNFFEMHDQITGLMNRAAMFTTIDHRSRPQFSDSPFGLILIDINKFSRLNESYGHVFGDHVLQQFAERIVRVIGNRHPICRHGEDEFMVLIEHDSEHWIEDLAKQLLDTLAQEFEVDGIPVALTSNAGISFFPGDGNNANDLVSAAHIAMQQAKEAGPSIAARYSAEYGRREDERRELELQLSQAVHGAGLELLYQPIYDLRLQELSSCEVLLRWRSPVLGSVSPSVFLPYAEESGLIIPIGEWVLRHACAQAAAWSQIEGGAVPVSVNVSAKQFGSPGFAHTVASILAETECSPFLLVLELTETTIAENPSVVSRTIAAIRRLGVKVSIDDFGTGYSSLSYLKHFQVDTLKIDQSFIHSIGHSRQDDALMQAAISLAHTLGLTAVAEGVETEEQLQFLMGSGCDQVQGFLLNRPMNAAQFTDVLVSQDTRLHFTGH